MSCALSLTKTDRYFGGWICRFDQDLVWAYILADLTVFQHLSMRVLVELWIEVRHHVCTRTVRSLSQASQFSRTNVRELFANRASSRTHLATSKFGERTQTNTNEHMFANVFTNTNERKPLVTCTATVVMAGGRYWNSKRVMAAQK